MEEGEFSCFSGAGASLSSGFGRQNSWFSHLWTLEVAPAQTSLLGSEASVLSPGLSHTTGFILIPFHLPTSFWDRNVYLVPLYVRSV